MYIDIAIGVIGLLAFFIGLAKGTLKTFLKLLSIVGSVLITVYLMGALAEFVMSNDALKMLILGDGISIKALFAGAEIDYSSSATLTALYSPIIDRINEMGYLLDSSNALVSESDVIVLALALHTAMLVVFLIAYFAVRIVVMIISSIIKKIVGDREITGFSRLIGGLISTVNGLLISLMLVTTALVITPIGGVGEVITPITDESYLLNTALSAINEVVDGTLVSDDTILKAIEYAGYTFAE